LKTQQDGFYQNKSPPYYTTVHIHPMTYSCPTFWSQSTISSETHDNNEKLQQDLQKSIPRSVQYTVTICLEQHCSATVYLFHNTR